MPSEEEYYQQEEFTHKRKPTSTANKSKPMPPEHSLFIFSPTNFLRQKCHWLCNHSYFGNVVLLCIMVSSAMLITITIIITIIIVIIIIIRSPPLCSPRKTHSTPSPRGTM